MFRQVYKIAPEKETCLKERIVFQPSFLRGYLSFQGSRSFLFFRVFTQQRSYTKSLLVANKNSDLFSEIGSFSEATFWAVVPLATLSASAFQDTQNWRS